MPDRTSKTDVDSCSASREPRILRSFNSSLSHGEGKCGSLSSSPVGSTPNRIIPIAAQRGPSGPTDAAVAAAWRPRARRDIQQQSRQPWRRSRIHAPVVAQRLGASAPARSDRPVPFGDARPKRPSVCFPAKSAIPELNCVHGQSGKSLPTWTRRKGRLHAKSRSTSN